MNITNQLKANVAEALEAGHRWRVWLSGEVKGKGFIVRATGEHMTPQKALVMVAAELVEDGGE